MPTLAGKIEEEIAPFVREYGCEVVKVSILEQNRNKILQILIEKIDGNSADINDCQILSRALSLKLDVMNLIPYRYFLEVSSAGVDRPLVKKTDYVRFCGKYVVIKTRVAKFGSRTLKGVLETANESGITLKLDVQLDDKTDVVSVLFDEISSAHIDGLRK